MQAERNRNKPNEAESSKNSAFYKYLPLATALALKKYLSTLANRRSCMSYQDVLQEALLALHSHTQTNPKPTTSTVYRAVWFKITQAVIYQADLVREPYHVHWQRWKMHKEDKFIQYENEDVVQHAPVEPDIYKHLADEETYNLIEEFCSNLAKVREISSPTDERKMSRLKRLLTKKINYYIETGRLLGNGIANRQAFRSWREDIRQAVDQTLQQGVSLCKRSTSKK
ncbi:MAG: hypothetical protein DRP09_15530 [Candidatus Thorarchaeota archaeon]|nr:MAG: hypothetical protein DRP09_15530 [Candidatus Thorarchaeota archaeon]